MALVVIAVAAFIVYSVASSSSESPLRTGVPTPLSTVQPVNASTEPQVLKATANRLGAQIQVPQFVPGPANTLVAVGSNSQGEPQLGPFIGSATPVTNWLPAAVLRYQPKDGGSGSDAEALTIYEIAGDQSGTPPGGGGLANSGSNDPYELWILNYSANGVEQHVYNFRAKTRRDIFVFSGPDTVSRDDVVRMYNSMK